MNGLPGTRTVFAEIGPVRPHARDWVNLRRQRHRLETAAPGRTMRRPAPQ